MNSAPQHTDVQGIFSKHRLEALADGLFAIVMTLLVLEFKAPDLPRHSPNAEILHALAPLWRVAFAFLITFMLASVYWMTQQGMLICARVLDRAGIVLNLGAMMFVSLLPFSTGMLARFLDTRIGMGVYFGNQFAIASLLAVYWFRARHCGHVDASGPEVQRLTHRILGLTFGPLFATLLAMVNPQYAFMGYVIPIIYLRALARKRKAAPAKA